MSQTATHINGLDDYVNYINNDKRVIIVDFFASWCGPCKKLSPILDQLSQKYSKEIAVLKVNADEDSQLPTDQQLVPIFKVSSLPTVFFVKGGQFQQGDDYRIEGFNLAQLLKCLTVLTGKQINL